MHSQVAQEQFVTHRRGGRAVPLSLPRWELSAASGGSEAAPARPDGALPSPMGKGRALAAAQPQGRALS